MSAAPPLDAAAWVAAGHHVPVRDGRALFVRAAGEGPTVLLLHGYPTWSWDWSRVTPLLKAHARGIAPDLLGFGYSDKPRRRYTIGGQADVIEDLLSQLGIEAIHLVAHDYGTIVAQELLDRRRSGRLAVRIDSVTLLNAAIVAGLHRPSRAHRMLSRPLVGAALAAATPPGRWRKGLQSVAGRDHRIDDAEWAQLWSGMAHGGDRVQLHRMLHYIADRRAHSDRWEDALAAFDGPLRLVWGLQDPISGAHVLEQARTRYPRAQVVELPGVGHWPQLEAPSAVADAIVRALP